MSDITKIKDLSWMKKMGEDYLTVWEKLAEKYADRLNEHPIRRETAYTNHDFTHHCKNIYVILETIFLKNVFLQPEEYFVLAAAVLLHDISMTQTNFDRLCHSKQSADYIEEEIAKGEDVWKKVPQPQVPIIKALVEAHTDIKKLDEDGREVVDRYTLSETKGVMVGEMGRAVHVKWLAGVLRLADELDVTYSRMSTADHRYKELNSEDKNQCFSQECWKRLNYFSGVRKCGVDIQLVLNEQYLKTHLNDDRTNIINGIKDVRQTISKKLNNINELVFDADEECCNYIKLKNVRLIDEQHLFDDGELDDDLGNEILMEEEPIIGLLDPDKVYTIEGIAEEETIQEPQIKVLRDTLENKITDYIYDKELIHYGHYRLNRLYCAKDWIDVRSILSDPGIGNECIDLITTDLQMFMDKKAVKDVLAVGVGMNGNIMASRVAYRLGLPFSYVVPAKPGVIGSAMEQSFRINEGEKVVLFAGVISSMDTIMSVIEKELKGATIFRIYTVLLREPLPKQCGLSSKARQIASNIMCLNKDFSCEMIPAAQCMSATHGKCVARNFQAYKEVYELPLVSRDSSSGRIFVNNVIGCEAGCTYCYLPKIGIQGKTIYSFEEVKAEFQRLSRPLPEESIISIGCYAECMLEENLECMKKIVSYFAELGYDIQIATKKKIPLTWLNQIEDLLLKKNQLNIFVSIPTVSNAEKIEPEADAINLRLQNFEYKSKNGKVRFVMYIKPFLEGITDQDADRYLEMLDKYKIDVVVGALFQSECQSGEKVKVGDHEMFEKISTKREEFIHLLSSRTKVYKHSVDVIRENMS